MAHKNAEADVVAQEYGDPPEDGGCGGQIRFLHADDSEALVDAWINPDTGKLHISVKTSDGQPPEIEVEVESAPHPTPQPVQYEVRKNTTNEVMSRPYETEADAAAVCGSMNHCARGIGVYGVFYVGGGRVPA